MSNLDYSCENATQHFGKSEVQCNNGDISVHWATTVNINTQNRAYQREKVSPRSWQKDLMLTILVNTYAGIPEIHVRVIEIEDGEYRYELIDGQQRMRAILDFINGDYVLPEDLVVDGCDLSEMNSEDIRNYYPKIYQRILDYRISCKWYEDLTDQETAFLFIKVLNNVTTMAKQELRNAILGPYSDYVRNTARGNGMKGKNAIEPHPLFERYVKIVKGEEKEYLTHFSKQFTLAGRMEVDEWLSSLIYFMHNGYKKGISHDKHYDWVEKIQSPKGEYAKKFKHKSDVDSVLNFALDLMKSTPDQFKVKLNPMTSLVMVLYALELRNREYKVIPEKFSPAFFDTYMRWSDTSTKLYMNHTEVNGRQMKEFRTLFGGKNSNAIATIFKVLDMDWKGRESEVGIIRFDSRKTFSRSDIERKWQEQGGKCFYSKNPIDIDNLAGDHYIPLSWGIHRGGVTEYSNLVVCTKGLNLRKGNMHGDDFIEYLNKESKELAA